MNGQREIYTIYTIISQCYLFQLHSKIDKLIDRWIDEWMIRQTDNKRARQNLTLRLVYYIYMP